MERATTTSSRIPCRPPRICEVWLGKGLCRTECASNSRKERAPELFIRRQRCAQRSDPLSRRWTQVRRVHCLERGTDMCFTSDFYRRRGTRKRLREGSAETLGRGIRGTSQFTIPGRKPKRKVGRLISRSRVR